MVGGVMVHLTRSTAAAPCTSARRHLVHGCTAAAQQLAKKLAARPGSAQTAPYGMDPAFDTLSELFDADAAAHTGDYYNTSAGSDEVFASGMPHGVFSREVPGLPEGYPVVFPVRSSVDPACAPVLHQAVSPCSNAVDQTQQNQCSLPSIRVVHAQLFVCRNALPNAIVALDPAAPFASMLAAPSCQVCLWPDHRSLQTNPYLALVLVLQMQHARAVILRQLKTIASNGYLDYQMQTLVTTILTYNPVRRVFALTEVSLQQQGVGSFQQVVTVNAVRVSAHRSRHNLDENALLIGVLAVLTSVACVHAAVLVLRWLTVNRSKVCPLCARFVTCLLPVLPCEST